MNPLIVVILIIILMASAVGGALYFAIKKIDPRGNDKTEDPYIKTVQEFLPFESITNDTIILSGHKYRAVIECSATNYNLKTPAERAIIEASFQRFLNAITFPITFFLQTKVIDNSKRLQLLHEEIQATLSEFPNMSEYAEQYERDMADLNNKIGNIPLIILVVLIVIMIIVNLKDLLLAINFLGISSLTIGILFKMSTSIIFSSVEIDNLVLITKSISNLIISILKENLYKISDYGNIFIICGITGILISVILRNINFTIGKNNKKPLRRCANSKE